MPISVRRGVLYFSNNRLDIEFETLVSTGAVCQSLLTNESNNYVMVFRDTLLTGFRCFKV
jgi:hypothetical protein